MSGYDLLTDFREKGSEQAFSELVRSYTNLVYSAAKRRLVDSSLAQEATQIVFIRLAKAAPKLRTDAELTAWLHRTTLHVAIDLWRSESRRRIREEQAAIMQSDSHEATSWNDLAPVLDDALNTLKDGDRQTILLRFFQRKTMRDLGTQLGISEDAAKMRVGRALDRLREKLTARGITATAAVIGALLTERAVEAAPIQIATTLAAMKFSEPVASAFGGLGGVVSSFPIFKVAAGAVAALAIAFLLFRSSQQEDSGGAPVRIETSQTASTLSNSPGDVLASEADPDPEELLQQVIKARQGLRSGTLKLDVFGERIQRGHNETNLVRLDIVFDGTKRWFDSVGREYSYASNGSEGAAEDDFNIQQRNLDLEGAVRAGLLKGFEAHVTTMYDGAALFRYSESDGKSQGASIHDPSKGSYTYIFDPRLFGLDTTFSLSFLEDILRFARPLQLVGKEIVDGTETWHIRLGSNINWSIWIDAHNPSRVIQYQNSREEIRSLKYNGTTLDDPLPTEVICVRSGRTPSKTVFTRQSAEFNVEVDPTFWTLAGLRMVVGTDVSDGRIHRRIGYWTGSGLSDDLPRKGKEAQPVPDRRELLALLDSEPDSEAALQAARWILHNTPDGADVEKAASVILSEHIRNPDLKSLAQDLERVRHRSSTNLLTAMLEENPTPEVQATACFALGTLFKDQWTNGLNKVATAEAEKYFARVVDEFSSAGKTGPDLARRAAMELHEIRNLAVGRPAPETTGEDIGGRSISLSSFRGKVVVLFFWSASSTSDLLEHDKVARELAGKRVQFIGVNSDEDPEKAKKALAQHKVSWPSLQDGRHGPIYTSWNVDSWPTIIILDRNGMIRHRGLRSWDVAKAVDALLQE